MGRVSSTRDISYRRDISNFPHHNNCIKGDLVEKVRNLAGPAIPLGSATAYAKHRRAQSMESMPEKAQTEVKTQSYPTDIKYLEKLIQLTGPNHRNLAGGRT